MRIITEPEVRLVGRPSVDEGELAGFLADEDAESWTTDTEIGSQKLVEVAGRLCYKSYARPRPGGNAAYIGHILEVGHGSVIEHAVYNFIVTGVSRSFSHELVRHRAGWAYSQRSQRYCDESEGSFVVPAALVGEVRAARAYILEHGRGLTASELLGVFSPAGIEPDPRESAGLHWLSQMDRSRSTYEELSDYLTNRGPVDSATNPRKRAREAARSVLPNATETQIFLTVNARAARHFIETRGDESADSEIRAVAVAMLRILRAESPNLFGDYIVTPCPSGGEVVDTPYRKV